MATCVSDEVREVLASADAGAFFGPNRKRAQIRYRRLARMVHPDMGGSEEAMARLNVLWDEYNGRKPDGGALPLRGHAKRQVRRVLRGGALACG